mmetsp:Transcript_53528/g.142676  ORF Transcript_53528/g.142676 Transcript_53528/m.142676 type:complete len:407 (-) Transcript_53528:139-1359(-)
MAGARVVTVAKKKNKISGNLHGEHAQATGRSEWWSEQEAPLLATPMRSAVSGATGGSALEPQERICQLLQDWSQRQRTMHAEQQQVIDRLLSAQQEALQEMRRLEPREGTPRCFAAASTPKEGPASTAGEGSEAPVVDATPQQGADAVARKVASQMARYSRQDEMLDFWKRTHGMHTVDKWVMDYKDHPGGWGALLMIHGVGEMTGRLRSKVENYAIYSALFLSMSIALIADPADFIYKDCEDLLCKVEKRIFVYGLAIGTALHMLCIMLGMAFVNALNETARDADVYRLLQRGQGFHATKKCSLCFMIGCAADFLAVGVTAIEYLDPVEPLALYAVLLMVVGVIYFPTANRLYESSSIVSYWREELGGKPDPNDPYDLQVPAGCVHERATMNDLVFRSTLHEAPM